MNEIGFCGICHFDVRRGQPHRIIKQEMYHTACLARARKRFWIGLTIALAFGLLFGTYAYANHQTIPVLQDKVVYDPLPCLVDKTGNLSEKGEMYLCFPFFSQDEKTETIWVGVFDTKTRMFIFVIEVKGEKAKVVWRKGQVGI